MQGVLFTPPNNRQIRPEMICAECGHLFQPRTTGAAAEELCDECYEGQFEPVRLRHWQPARNRREHHTH